MITTTTLHASLKENFGFEKFRTNQEEIIQSLLDGKDTLAIMPTGGGKSICFQLPALLFSGITIVISPLIALMKDQVDSLKANGIAACYINSSQTDAEQQAHIQDLTDGRTKIVYVAPESLSYLGPARLFAGAPTIDNQTLLDHSDNMNQNYDNSSFIMMNDNDNHDRSIDDVTACVKKDLELIDCEINDLQKQLDKIAAIKAAKN